MGDFCRHIKNVTTFLKSATAIKEHAAQKDLIAVSNCHLYDVWVYFDKKNLAGNSMFI